MIPRIMGVETEYAASFTDGGRRPLAADEAARAMFREIVRRDRSSNVFTANGGRLYLDVGNHPEYATAECTDLLDVLAQDRAGELMVADLAASAQEYLAGEGVVGELRVLKNNVDSAGNSYGCHENYMVPRTSRLEQLSGALVPFLVSRQVMCGAGHLLAPRGESGPPRFVLSQRAHVVWEGVSSATTRSRPMINSRDEPHADPSTHRRLHVIVGDSNMSQTTTFLKVGATELLLRLLESGVDAPVAALASDAKAIRAISLDRHATVALQDGRNLTGVQIQREHFEAVSAFAEREGYPGEHDRDVLALWDRVLGALERDDVAALGRDVDWAIKLRLMRRMMERSGTDWTDPRVAALDLLFHDVRPASGLFPSLERSGAVSRMIDDARAERALATPPATRAADRGRFIAAAREIGAEYSVDWTRLRSSSPVEAMVELLDPFAHGDRRVDGLIERMRALSVQDGAAGPPV